MFKSGRHIVLLLFIIIVALGFSVAYAPADEKQGSDKLLEIYHRNVSRLEKNSFGAPLFMESFEQGDRVYVNVYGVFDHAFSKVEGALVVPSNWCDIVSLHQNVKACTFRELPGRWDLAFYIGRKIYQSPEDATEVIYHYRKVEQRQGYLDIMLNAEVGPFSTKDHNMRFEAIPVDAGQTFVHVSYAYNDSPSLRFAQRLYFATIGSGKAGFTVTGKDNNGGLVYIGGPRGAIERNAVRYYLAVQSFMDTLAYPDENRFNMRTSRWYDLTLQYRKQLFELDKKDYLAFKTKEHQNQVIMQQKILSGHQ